MHLKRDEISQLFHDKLGSAQTDSPEELTMIGLRQMFYARLPDVKGTAGSVAFPLDEVLHASPAYRWTLNHTMEVDDPMELFPTHVIDITGA
jgi:hypothetical protein